MVMALQDEAPEGEGGGGALLMLDHRSGMAEAILEHRHGESQSCRLTIALGRWFGRRPSGSCLGELVEACQQPLGLLVDRGAIGSQVAADLGHGSGEIERQSLGEMACEGEYCEHQRLVLEQSRR